MAVYHTKIVLKYIDQMIILKCVLKYLPYDILRQQITRRMTFPEETQGNWPIF